MQELEHLTRHIEAVFTRIQDEQMGGIPLLNPLLRVKTLGFRHYRSRATGILITPWMMNLLLFPAEGEDWSDLKLGDRRRHRFPANEYPFMVNEIDGLGRFQTHSVYSPMHEFINQDHAEAAADSFLERLMTEAQEPDRDPHDEELLGRILRGEEIPEAVTDPHQREVEGQDSVGEGFAGEEGGITRRQLLRRKR